MAGRLGNLIYWATTFVALLIAGVAAYGYLLGSGGSPFAQAYAVTIAALIWLLGAGARYVLKG